MSARSVRSRGEGRVESVVGALAGPLALALLFAALAAWSWRKWADPVIDFGAELYIPWRLAEGDVLYRDIAYRNGPLSPYLNALWFRALGVSATTLFAANAAILAATCALTWRVFRGPAGRFGAGVAVAAALALFGFPQLVGIGNFNWIAPYQHSQTHGVALGVALVAAWGRFARTRRPVWLAVAGACAGAVALTKAEIQVGVLAAAALGAVLAAASAPRGRALPELAAFGGAALAVQAGAAAALAVAGGGDVVVAGLLGNWRYLAAPLDEPFYRAGAGLDAPLANAGRALAATAALAALAVAALAAGRRRAVVDPAAERRARAGALVLGVAVAGLAFVVVPGRLWFEGARALPVVAAVAAGVSVRCAWRARAAPARLAAAGSVALWSVMALGLLAKMILHARVQHYGFALALPAGTLLAAGLTGALPRRLHGGGRAVARALATAPLAAAVLFALAHADRYYARKTVRVGRGGDALLAAPARGAVVRDALDWLGPRVREGDTLLALPEGLGFNYWLRLRNPARYFLFIPPEWEAVGGESVVLAEVRDAAPDWILLVDRPHAEFGVGPFGRDPRNGRALLDWVESGYRRAVRLGAEPFAGGGFGVAVLRRGPPSASTGGAGTEPLGASAESPGAGTEPPGGPGTEPPTRAGAAPSAGADAGSDAAAGRVP